MLPAMPFTYDTPREAIAGAIYTLRELARRGELPAWLRRRAETEAAACEDMFKRMADQ